MRMILRAAAPTDAEEIARLTALLGYRPAPDSVRTRLRRFAADEDHHVLVAAEGERVLGWIHVALRASVESDTWAEILGFVVDEDARGRGTGGELLEASCDWAGRRGAGRMRVRSRSERRSAHRFYEARGFAWVKAQPVMDLDRGEGRRA